MRIRVHEATAHTHYGRRYADWQATCTCGDRLWTPDWESAMTWACGHLTFHHPRPCSCGLTANHNSPCRRPKWADLFGMAPDMTLEQLTGEDRA